MSPIIRVCLADRHRLFHIGIETIIKQTEDIAFSGSATTETDTLRFCRERVPHILLLAFNILTTSPTSFVNTFRQECPHTKIIALLADVDETCIRSLLENGVSGCILKNEGPEDLLAAIQGVMAAETWVSSALLKKHSRRKTLIRLTRS
ncbi:MAG: response regulator transcription factor [Anaerolineae bacterium]|nr:response regulator transcription factor [Anaerolineae bacterium]